MKRLLDIGVSLIALIIVLPVLVLISLLIKLESKGPVLFRQKRVGKDKDPFHILKFRTMRVDAPKEMPTHLLQNADAYITKVGKFLRKTSLDELPQLVNIIKGEMSLVGPRPALFNQTDLLQARDQYRANNITPGLTGWAQINGRDELPIEVKAALDGEYVQRMSVLFDIKIVFKTFGNVLRSRGVQEGRTEERTKMTAQKELS